MSGQLKDISGGLCVDNMEDHPCKEMEDRTPLETALSHSIKSPWVKLEVLGYD